MMEEYEKLERRKRWKSRYGKSGNEIMTFN